MSAACIERRLVELLQQARNPRLFELNAVIERMLADPHRTPHVREDLHLGQSARLMDWRDGRMRVRKVIAFKDTLLPLRAQLVDGALHGRGAAGRKCEQTGASSHRLRGSGAKTSPIAGRLPSETSTPTMRFTLS